MASIQTPSTRSAQLTNRPGFSGVARCGGLRSSSGHSKVLAPAVVNMLTRKEFENHAAENCPGRRSTFASKGTAANTGGDHFREIQRLIGDRRETKRDAPAMGSRRLKLVRRCKLR